MSSIPVVVEELDAAENIGDKKARIRPRRFVSAESPQALADSGSETETESDLDEDYETDSESVSPPSLHHRLPHPLLFFAVGLGLGAVASFLWSRLNQGPAAQPLPE